MAFLVGIVLEIISGMVGVIGKQLIGFSARQGESPYAKVAFSLGMFMTTILGAVLDATAYGFAPQSILAPLHGMEISMNICFAPCVLQEKVAPAHVVGTLLVSAGASLTAVFGPHGEAPVSLEDLQTKLFRWQVLAYVVALCGGIVMGFSILKVRPKGSGKVRGVVLGVLAGGIAGNMCFLKCTMELVMLGFGGDWSPWTNWLPYALAILAASVAIGNVPLMVIALQEYEALFMVTIHGGSNIIMACISGAVVLCEMDGVETTQVMQYWASVLLIISGLLAINTAEVHGIGDDGGEESETGSDISPIAISPTKRRGSVGSRRDLQNDGRVAILWATPVGGFRAAGKTPRARRTMERALTWAGELQRSAKAKAAVTPPGRVTRYLSEASPTQKSPPSSFCLGDEGS